MTRVEGWERRLNAVIATHKDLPSVFGTSDCFQICNDTVIAVTGEPMFENIYYNTEAGAAKLLLKRGFLNVEDAFASKFDQVPVAMAQRGDIGVYDDNGALCGGVFTQLGFMVRDAEQILFLPVTIVKTAFKVGR